MVSEIGYCIVAVDFRREKTFIKVRCVEHFCSTTRRDFYNFVFLKKKEIFIDLKKAYVLSRPYIPVLALDEHSMI